MITYCGQPAMQFRLFSTMLPPRIISGVTVRAPSTPSFEVEEAPAPSKVQVTLPPGTVFQGARYGDTPVAGEVSGDILTLPTGSGDLQIDLE